MERDASVRAGGRSGQAGDLYLTIRVRNTTAFKRIGDDLHLDLDVNVFVAMLGGKFEVPTIEGKRLNINIPEGAQNGKKLRIKGKGMPVYGKSQQKGDMYVIINVKIPEKLNEHQKQLIRDLKDSF